MKFKPFLVFASILMSFAWKSDAQISPDPSGIFCPGTTTVFTVTLPSVQSVISVSGSSVQATSGGTPYNTVPASVSGQPYSIEYPNGTTTRFKFNGSFIDDNTPQTFMVSYGLNNDRVYYTFTKIQSFLHEAIVGTDRVSLPSVNGSTLTAPRCISGTYNVTFADVKMANNVPNGQVAYGTVTQYRYLLPAGWILGSSLSDGVTWQTAGSNVNITTNTSTGDGGKIYIRALNPCNSTYSQGPQAQINISRPAPTLAISGSSLICGWDTYTMTGIPPGSTVSWTLAKDPASTIVAASIPAGSISTSVTVTRTGVSNGKVVLTGTVTDCNGGTTASSKVIEVGTPVVMAPDVYYPTNGCLQMYSNVYYKANLSAGAPYGNLTWGYEEGQFNNTLHIVYPNELPSVAVQIAIPNNQVYNRIYVAGFNDCGVGGPAIKVFTFTANCPGGGISDGVKPGIAHGTSSDLQAESEVAGAKGFRVSPVPANDHIIISGSSLSGKMVKGVRLYDAQGRVISALNGVGQSTAIRFYVSRVAAGVYFVEILSGDTKEVHRVLITR